MFPLLVGYRTYLGDAWTWLVRVKDFGGGMDGGSAKLFVPEGLGLSQRLSHQAFSLEALM